MHSELEDRGAQAPFLLLYSCQVKRKVFSTNILQQAYFYQNLHEKNSGRKQKTEHLTLALGRTI